MTSVVATAAALAFTAAPAQAATPTSQATANARILKPLSITWNNTNLNFGDIVLDTNAFTATVRVPFNGGPIVCPAPLTCSGSTSVASYNVSGTNNQLVHVDTPDVQMDRVGGGGSIMVRLLAANNLAPSGVAGDVLLPNSGNSGVNVAIGGEFDLTEATPDGVYAGDFAVTADYM
jgi:hypothetical protein